MPISDYEKIAAAIRYLRNNAVQQPQLEEIAARVGLSPFHFQRLFQRFAGVSPKRFLQHLTADHARRLLLESKSVLDASWETGLSGGGRLHDLLVQVEAVTPGELKAGGKGVQIRWGLHPTPFGDCLLALTDRGICSLQFVDHNPEQAQQRLAHDWPRAELSRDQRGTENPAREIFTPLQHRKAQALSLLLKGTNFQIKVWRALLRIPPGRILSYAALAEKIDQPGAARAVGKAVGANPVAWLIPCHRVLREDGGIGGYRWGTERKLAILGREWSREEASAEEARS